MLIYDCETLRPVPPTDGLLPDIEYCEGWQDFTGMGISVIGAYDYVEAAYRVYLEDNRAEFFALARMRGLIVGFNNHTFDDPLITAHGCDLTGVQSYDILREIIRSLGVRFSLDAMCRANFAAGKVDQEFTAPILWQRGQWGAVIDYCLRDVWLTKKLLDQIITDGKLVNPKTRGYLKVERPHCAFLGDEA